MSRQKILFHKKHVTLADGLDFHTRISQNERTVSTIMTDIVLVHGLSVSSGYMMPTAVLLAPYHRIWVPDLPGFGNSIDPPHILNVPQLADALAAWMPLVGLTSATFLGHSLGCQIIVNLAIRHPERVNQTILVSPTMDQNALTIHQEAGRLLKDAPCEPFHFLPVLVGEYLRAGILRTIRTLQYAFEDPIEANLSQVRVPTLVIRGEHDPIVLQPWAERVHQLIPGSEFVTITGAGHAVNYNSPKKLVEHVQDFLVRVNHKVEVEKAKVQVESNGHTIEEE